MMASVAIKELISACEEGIKAMYNLAPGFKSRGCFGRYAKDPECNCIVCEMFAAIGKGKIALEDIKAKEYLAADQRKRRINL